MSYSELVDIYMIELELDEKTARKMADMDEDVDMLDALDGNAMTKVIKEYKFENDA